MKLGYLFLFCGVVAGAIHPPVVSNFNCSKKWKYDSTLVTLSNKGVNDVFTSLWDIVRHTADNSATIETDFHEDKGPMTFVARKIELLEVDLHSDPETKLIDDDSKILVSIKNMKMKVKVYLLMSLHFGIVDTDNTDVVITAWIDNGSLKLIFHNYHRENGTPIIELSKITMKAEGFDFDVEGNIIIRAMGKVMKLFKNKLKKMIETKSKEEFRKFYDIVISNKLPSLQTNMTFGNNFKMNYGMTSDAFIMKNKLFIPINGNIYKNEHALTKFDGALDGYKMVIKKFDKNDAFYLAPAAFGYFHYRVAAIIGAVFGVILLCSSVYGFFSMHNTHAITGFWATLFVGVITGLFILTSIIMIYAIVAEKASLMWPQMVMIQLENAIMLAVAIVSILVMSCGAGLTEEVFKWFVDVKNIEDTFGPIWPFNIATLAFMGSFLCIWFNILVRGTYDYLLDKEFFENLENPCQAPAIEMKYKE
uniref:Secreted ookinete protein n=1 Tax=Rhabditophanes sp. KR3021 TaxID=114890 RepID=A0AC35TUR7_9BILA